jgi:predicted nucleotidyltransferase
MDRAAIISTVKQYFAQRSQNVVAAYVFGSVGRGSSRPRSDVDIAVLYATPPMSAVSGPASDMQAELEALLRRPVDLIVLNDAPVDLVHRVLRDGEIVCETDRGARIDFEVDARRRYLDLLPVLRRYRASA